MPLSRAQKEELVERYGSDVVVAPHLYLLRFRGISVPQVTLLRDKVRESGGHYLVVKNRLILRTLGEGALAELEGEFQGPTAVAYSDTDPVALAKVLTEFAKEADVLEFRGGLVDGRRVEASEIEEIASLPSREVLLTKLVFLLQSPITGLVRVLAALPERFVRVVEQVRKKKEDVGSDD